MVSVTAFFAGILGFMFILLSIQVVRGRAQNRVAIGDGGHAELKYRIRAHGNFAEYAPFAIILMGLCELTGTGGVILTLLGAALVAGRLSHAYSLLVVEPQNPGNILFRKIGMGLTLSVIGISALLAVF